MNEKEAGRFWIGKKPVNEFDTGKRAELWYNDEKKVIGVNVDLIQLDEKGALCVLSRCYLDTEELEILLEKIRKYEREEKIEIPIEYAKNIYKILENSVSMGFEIVSQEVKDIVSEEAYKKLTEIFNKYHNANCGPFNRTLKKLIESGGDEMKR